ncbi:MAG: hypothetical protein ACLQGV_17160 [Bryobacteraceae bacterium]
MCLMLYFAAASPIGKEGRARLTLEDLREDEVVVRQWFSMPHVMFVGVDGGCSCEFPSVRAEIALLSYEGMFREDEDREDEIALGRELIALIQECLSSGPRVELYAAFLTSPEITAPKGTISLKASELDARTLFFNEQYFYEITA